MFDLLRILIQFVFRVTFGLALAMGVTPPKLVTSGYYQKHLWVLMGLNTLASLSIFSSRKSLAEVVPSTGWLMTVAIVLAVLNYVGSVCWLAEKKQAGGVVLYLTALLGLTAAILATPLARVTTSLGVLLTLLDLASGGLVLGVTLAAMFLGHWYLNTPTMQLVPLKKLVIWMGVAILIRTLLCAAGLVLRVQGAETLPTEFWIFITLRWLSGLLGTLAMAWLTWETLKVPNTQSATGLLYAGVILAFIGELTSQLMSVGELYPV